MMVTMPRSRRLEAATDKFHNYAPKAQHRSPFALNRNSHTNNAVTEAAMKALVYESVREMNYLGAHWNSRDEFHQIR
jgi:hypothetical protein